MPGKRKLNKKMQAFSSLMKLTKGMTNEERKKLIRSFADVVRPLDTELDGQSPDSVAKAFFESV